MTHAQLSFDVAPRTIIVAGEQAPAPLLGGNLKLKGELRADVNLEHGDELTVTVADADGNVIAQAVAEVDRPPSFAPVQERDIGLIGYVRAHTAKLGDPAS